VSSHSLTDVPEQNHDTMRAVAERRIVGLDPAEAHEPIPGEYDATTLTHRESGAMSGAFNGADTVNSDPNTLAEDSTQREWILEGGGRDGQRLVEKTGRKS
jgi:hypothetical protein